MSDLFLSYAREDRDAAERLAKALEDEGWSVWWDRELAAGERFSRVIEEELRSARAVVVAWSRASAASPWVEAEATVAFERGVLVPVLLEDCGPPLPFRTLQAQDLRGWGGEAGAAEVRALAGGVRRVLEGRAAEGGPSRVPELLAWAEEALAEAQRLAPEDEGKYWWWLRRQPGRADRLRLAVLLAAEARRRDQAPESEAALRGALALLTCPLLDTPCYGMAASTAWSPRGDRLAVAASEDGLRLLAAEGWRELWTAPVQGEARAVAFSPDGRVLAAGDEQGAIWLLEAEAGRPFGRLELGGFVSVLAFWPGGARLAAVAVGAAPVLWDVASQRELARLPAEATCEGGLAFSPRGDVLATAGRDGTVRLWDAAGRLVHALPLDGPASALAFHPTGEFLALGSERGPAQVWNPASGESRPVPGVRRTQALAWSPDGALVASGGYDGAVRLCSAAEGKQVRSVTHGSRVIDLAFSPDGALLATAGQDGTARVWDLASGAETARLTHTDNVNLVRFSPDGMLLLTASQDRTARVWRVRYDDPLAEACARLERNLTPDEWRRYLGAEPYRKTCPGLR